MPSAEGKMEINMIKISDKTECCGCGACIQICPRKCIDFLEDEEGFSYPSVNLQKCVDCNLCMEVCPIKNRNDRENEMQKTYIAYAVNEQLRNESSSGGIFSLLAEKVINKNGIVFGAAFDDDFLVEHIGVANNLGLKKLRGSKYLQSQSQNCYFETLQYLKKGKIVLYTGTACQIAGLKKYLKMEYDNLITVDILCHGVPSPIVWKRYLNEQEKKFNAKVKEISFRKKSKGWKDFSIEILFNNGEKIEEIFKNNIYMQLFLKNIILRPSCYKCRFKGLNRESDLTIGDCWGVENYMPEMDDDRGTSVIIVHSQKGYSLLKQCDSEIMISEADTDRALPPSADSRKSVPIHENRSKFFREFKHGNNFEKMSKLIKESRVGLFKRSIKWKLRSILNKIGILKLLTKSSHTNKMC